MEKNDKLVQIFDNQAKAYDLYRPGYPMQAIDDIIGRSQLKQSDNMLEIGCGTGQITMPFLDRGFSVTAVEKGEALVEVAAEKMSRYTKARVIHHTFETWETSQKFKLVISAQAFHWIDKKKGVDKIVHLLEPNGYIGLIWNMDVSQHTDFWKSSQQVYDKYFSSNGDQKSMEETVWEHEDYLGSRVEFKEVVKRTYEWEQVYSKENYLGLLRTFSSHMILEEAIRTKFFDEMTRTIEENGNQVKRFYQTVVLSAQCMKG